eukprot:CAMPEP_0176471256 /NCGR_PEP_ID=MMETSP0127-20121128/41028_1 /TAXON_ID=938130 /ORGANISM="Platyophrya macrostoma, Strain WH" /LENGTH=249 /DNA_ID=CAMNT_0017865877 /DNA_START=329 /DNA_END=1075 /DNA_ORIENTATION=+
MPTKKILMLNNDFVYAEIKDLHNVAVAEQLERRLVKVQELKGRINRQEKDLAKIQEVLATTSRIQKEMPLVSNHIAIREYFRQLTSKPAHFFSIKAEQSILDCVNSHEVQDYANVLIAKQAKLEKVLRLLCLQSQIENGLRIPILDSFKREILHVYGLTLNNLEKIGLLKREAGKSTWKNLDKQLKLINTEVNVSVPNDAAYAYDGYCPILVRLVEKLFLKGGWKTIQDALQLLDGATVYDEQAGVDIW